MNDHDHNMIRHAIARGPVIVQHNGQVLDATLIAWKPHRRKSTGKVHTNAARVRFTSGRELTVRPASNVSIA